MALTTMMRRVIDKIGELTPAQQDELATMIQDELSDRHWDQLFADPRSDKALAKLADEGRAARKEELAEDW